MKEIKKEKQKIVIIIGVLIGIIILICSVEYGRAYMVSNNIKHIIEEEIYLINEDNVKKVYSSIRDGELNLYALSTDNWQEDTTKEYFKTELIERLKSNPYIERYNVSIYDINVVTNNNTPDEDGYYCNIQVTAKIQIPLFIKRDKSFNFDIEEIMKFKELDLKKSK